MRLRWFLGPVQEGYDAALPCHRELLSASDVVEMPGKYGGNMEMAYDFGIVIPVYRSKESVRQVIRKLEEIFLPQIKIRICLVDDSGDGGETAGYLKKHCLTPEVALVVLDRNYGQQAAIRCGLWHVGPCRVYGTIDDDLEQPPQMLRMLYESLTEGYDLAYGIPEYESGHTQRVVGHGSGNICVAYRRLGSWMRDIVFTGMIGAHRGIRVSSLCVMKAEVAADAIGFPSYGFFYLSAAILKSAARNEKTLKINNLAYWPGQRHQGTSGYHVGKLLKLYGNLIWHYGLDLGAYGKSRGAYGRNREPYRIKEIVRPERLMVLGGSNCQLHGVQRARAMGVDTLLADYTLNPPAAAVCGGHERISTFDVEACKKAARQYQVTGVMTMGTDQPVYTAACVAGALGLPCMLTERQAFSVTNKKRMKQILSAAGIPTADYRIVDSGTGERELEGMRAPLVIKPLDSQGQRGIYKLGTPREILDHLPDTLSFSRCREALVEEYYDSDEVTVSGWMKAGELYILTVTDRLLYPDKTHIGVCTGHRFPSVHMGQYEEIQKVSRRTAEAFGLTNGPFYLQLLLGDEGVKVNELAARIGGAFEDVFIPWITGFDILGAVTERALGREAKVCCHRDCPVVCADRCVAVQLLFGSPGKIRSVTPVDELLKQPYVLDAGYNYREGQDIPVMENATARFGHAVICGTRENIGERVDEFYRRLSVRSDAGEEMIRRFYPGS